MNSYPVLVLSVDYSPFDVWSWKKTMRKLLGSHSVLPIYKENGEIIRHDRLIRDGKGNEYELPAIVMLKEYIKIQSQYASYSKTNIYARDLLQCQYCGKITTIHDRSVDHVIPKSFFDYKKHKFRLSSFENVVTCCKYCNLYKANRIPEQAGMKLIHKPIKPLRVHIYKNKLRLLSNIPHQWKQFLNNEIEKKK